MTAPLDRAAIDRVIRRHLKELRKPGVFTVRPGYEQVHGVWTDHPAIVVTVDRKLKRVEARRRLPESLGGYPVDVRDATAHQRLRHKSPVKYAIVTAYGRPHDEQPEYPLERRVSNGKLLSRLPRPRHPALTQLSQKAEVPYTPAKPPLRAVTRPMTIVACASPDAGFTVLDDFLASVRNRLTVAMYDFTSARLLSAIDDKVKGGRVAFTLVLDRPMLDPVANQTDEDTVASIHKTDGKARTAWALTRPDLRASKWIYPYAYHIKVAVRDGQSTWLSSGNWNVSNQPDFAADTAPDGAFDTADRDWHVILMDAGLSQLYEAYIEHDFQVASGAQGPVNAAVEKSIASANKELQADRKKEGKGGPGTTRVPFTLGKPRTFTDAAVTLQPLLTPDKGKRTTMYVENVLALIQSAKKTLFVQMQYINPSFKPEDKDFMLLVNGLVEALKRGVDVRIIASQYQNKHIEQMHEVGLSNSLRIQQRVHNKGIVVDSRAVLVSSQNWSAAGTLQNRDAGVIIHHEEIALYFQAIFVEDWEKRADPVKTTSTAPPTDAKTRAGSP